MKTEQRLMGLDDSPFEHDAVIVVSNKELAQAVGEWVEKRYGVDALHVVFEMKRKYLFSTLADVSASVDVRKRDL